MVAVPDIKGIVPPPNDIHDTHSLNILRKHPTTTVHKYLYCELVVIADSSYDMLTRSPAVQASTCIETFFT